MYSNTCRALGLSMPRPPCAAEMQPGPGVRETPYCTCVQGVKGCSSDGFFEYRLGAVSPTAWGVSLRLFRQGGPSYGRHSLTLAATVALCLCQAGASAKSD